ncbi:MAG TPA: glycosyltransferase family 4 protein [Pyrinomonadaceae bacterium]|nr:glycosyltransferase family 4 protein [Pyrinomonadaceae bacterium]
MRVLQISSAASFGGGERYVADLTRSLAARGHDVYAVLRPNSPLLGHLKLDREKIKTLPLRNALDVPSAHELARFVAQNEIEIVHAHMARDYSLAAYAARRNRRTKFIVTRHVLFQLSRLHRHTLARAHRVIAVSNAVARELRLQRIVSDSQLAVVRNGVDVDRFNVEFDRRQFLQKLGLPAHGPLVGSIGELRTLKRHDDFIRASARVASEFRDAHFVLAGVDTSLSREVHKHLEQLVIETGLAGRFHFLGWVEEAEKLLSALDVFVSASETESFGLAIAEAMAAGTPVVATATEGAREVVVDQETGLLVPIGDVARISESIALLLSDGERRRQTGARAREVVNEKFSLQRMVDQIEQIYRD